MSLNNYKDNTISEMSDSLNNSMKASSQSFEKIKRPPLSFSEHALVRLKERTSFTQEEITSLIKEKAFVKIRTSLSLDQVLKQRRFKGLDIEEVKNSLPSLLPYAIKYLMIWSKKDNDVFTFVIAVKDNKVITVLNSRTQVGKENWDNLVTEEVINQAKCLVEAGELSKLQRKDGYAFFCWEDIGGMIIRKRIKDFRFPSKYLPSFSEIESVSSRAIQMAKEITPDGYKNPRLLLLTKNGDLSVLLKEYLIELYLDGLFTVHEV